MQAYHVRRDAGVCNDTLESCRRILLDQPALKSQIIELTGPVIEELLGAAMLSAKSAHLIVCTL